MSNNPQWMIYGAYGFTGKLISHEAKSRELNPVLAGRDQEKVQALAEELGFEYIVFSLSNPSVIQHAIQDFDLVLHCAGPYEVTGRPMIDACIATSTHYLDITGEITIFEYAEEKSTEAIESNSLLLPGVGFDIVPTDCLGGLLAKEMTNADTLEIAIYGTGGASGGTSRSMIEILKIGGRVRENGELIKVPHAYKTKEIEFMNGKLRTCATIPLPDLVATYQATKIPNIYMFYAMKQSLINWSKRINYFRWLFKFSPFRKLLQWWVDKQVTDPNEDTRENTPSYIRAEIKNKNGETIKIGHIKTPNAYDFTAMASVKIVQYILEEKNIPTGFAAPSEVVGANFIKQIEGVEVQLG